MACSLDLQSVFLGPTWVEIKGSYPMLKKLPQPTLEWQRGCLAR